MRTLHDRMPQMHLVYVVFVFLLVALPLTECRLLQVQVVTRHGARTKLAKQAAKLTEGGAQLTDAGRHEMFALGRWLRARYLLPTVPADAIRGISGGAYDPAAVRLVSSDYDRTLRSGALLGAGMFANASNVSGHWVGDSLLQPLPPVHSVTRRNDFTIRAYDKCPALVAANRELFASGAWQRYEAAHALLLTHLAHSLAPRFPHSFPTHDTWREGAYGVPLEDVWNVWDALTVAKASDPAGELATGHALSDVQWAELAEVAHWAEWHKYGRVIDEWGQPVRVSQMIGANLLRAIAASLSKTGDGGGWPASGSATGGNFDRRTLRRRAGENDASDDLPERFVHFSAHYPVLVGLLAALQLPGANPQLEAAQFPSCASALIVELHDLAPPPSGGARRRALRLLWSVGEDDAVPGAARWSGARNVTQLVVPACSERVWLPGIEGGTGAFGCPVEQFAAALAAPSVTLAAMAGAAAKLSPEAGWCAVCNNTSADVCITAAANTANAATTGGGGSDRNTGRGHGTGVLVGVGLLCVCLGVAAHAAYPRARVFLGGRHQRLSSRQLTPIVSLAESVVQVQQRQLPGGAEMAMAAPVSSSV